MLTECRRTVRVQLEALQQRRENQVRATQHASGPGMVLVQPSCSLVVTSPQRIQLQQQIQQVREFYHDTTMNMLNLLNLPWSQGSSLLPKECCFLSDRCDSCSCVILICFNFVSNFFFFPPLQHVQLLTQVNMLCNPVEALQSESQTTKHFLVRKLGIKHTSVLFLETLRNNKIILNMV